MKKDAWEMSDYELARIAKWFYKAQLKHPQGMEYHFTGKDLIELLTLAMNDLRLSQNALRDVLLIFHRRAIIQIKMEPCNGVMYTTSLRAGSNTLVFVQQGLELRRSNLWTRWLAIAAIILSIFAIAVDIWDILPTKDGQAPQQPAVSARIPVQETPGTIPSAAPTTAPRAATASPSASPPVPSHSASSLPPYRGISENLPLYDR